MQVTIIFEDFNLSSLNPATSAKKSAERILRLKISRSLQIYLLTLVLGIGCFLFQMPITGIVVLCSSTLIFRFYSYFKNTYDVQINFSKEDGLDEILKEDLYD